MAETGIDAGETNKPVTDPLVAEIHKRIREAFSPFDDDNNGTVDVREVGAIIRSLGCYPTEAEIGDMLQEVEEEEPTGFIRLEKFLPMMTRVLQERRYQPASEEQLVQAFQVLDVDRKSHLTPEEIKKYLMEEGEKFTQDEMDEMLSAAVDKEKGTILYRDFVTYMLPENVQ
ncbi:Dynein regulatory complex protein 8 [Geodia barretti]|uniref:Dynein regulatory complex protein 8 n=1 Tax=Geodia barretti TaxID=519541 RepID=A0AA35RB79_GEOBA|nr:Dynein regulatory complex protein 8 [Geodia barretti]